eukprot:INCI12816.5.p1 GENE.INCI12816.5~~INCI12816.5.p1  ORF type:complete len:755 (-),score=127.09 INCI12816.5:1697-3961(-)
MASHHTDPAVPETVAILASERSRSTFDETTMTDFLNGGSAETAYRLQIMEEIDEIIEEARELEEEEAKAGGLRRTSPTVSAANGGSRDGDEEEDEDDDEGASSRGAMPNEDHTLVEARLQTMKMLRFQFNQLMMDAAVSVKKRQARIELMSLYDPSWYTKNGVHFGLWMGAIQGQGSMEQLNHWMPLTMTFQVFGCFAMTEMGHGSFLRGLETTATYDAATEEFTIHTPSVSATKWWIGGAGQTATHAAVFAQMILPSGENVGVHTFIVQIRSLEDHKPMPGVRLGDCGHKMGRNGLDNGWIQFDHVRVGRDALLSKYCQVTPAGSYSRSGSKQLAYGALIGGRATMVTDSALWLKAATTIAVRFLALRRQGEPLATKSKDSSDARSSDPAALARSMEPQILDYGTVQTRLMPLVATAYALNFTSKFMMSIAAPPGLKGDDSLEDETSSSGAPASEPANGEEDHEAVDLKDIHATCAGLKAFCTWSTYYGIDTCRQCIGGHGYSAYAALGRMFADFAVQCTWEGDNTVMALQTARYLVNCYEKVKRREHVNGTVSYLQSLPRINKKPRTFRAKHAGHLRNFDALLDAFRFLLAKKVERVAEAYGRHREKVGHAAAWNMHSPELVDCSRAHVFYVMSTKFADAVGQAQGSDSNKLRAVGDALAKVCQLFVLHSLSNWLDWFVATKYMSPSQMFLVKATVLKLCEDLRDIAVPLVDAFGLSDGLLRSPLGRRDGNVYQHYFERVAKHPHNRRSVCG